MTLGDFLDYLKWVFKNIQDERFPHHLEPEFISRSKDVLEIIFREQEVPLLDQWLFFIRARLVGSFMNLPLDRQLTLGHHGERAFSGLRNWVVRKLKQDSQYGREVL